MHCFDFPNDWIDCEFGTSTSSEPLHYGKIIVWSNVRKTQITHRETYPNKQQTNSSSYLRNDKHFHDNDGTTDCTIKATTATRMIPISPINDDIGDSDAWLELVDISSPQSPSILRHDLLLGSHRQTGRRLVQNDEEILFHDGQAHHNHHELLLIQLNVAGDNDGSEFSPSVILQVAAVPPFQQQQQQQQQQRGTPSTTPSTQLNMMHENDDEQDNENVIEPMSVLLLVHPVMFQFLSSCSLLSDRRQQEQEQEEERQRRSGRGDVTVSIAPLPMLQYQIFQGNWEYNEKNIGNITIEPITISPRQLISTKTMLLPKGSAINVSCTFVMTEDTTTHHGDNHNNHNMIIGIGMEGRWIKKGCTMLISTTHFGLALVKITDVTVIEQQQQHDDERDIHDATHDVDVDNKVYRFGCVDDYIVHVHNLSLSSHHHENDRDNDAMITPTATTIPGYEPLLNEVIGLCRTKLDKEIYTASFAAAPSAILITGCAGVGKTRLAACVKERLVPSSKSDPDQCLNDINNISSSNNMSGDRNYNSFHHYKCCSITVQDLIFRASIETDLLMNVIAPQIDDGCTIVVIDDMHLLECDTASDETMDSMIEEQRQSSEYMMVQNAIVDAVDRYQRRCVIIGISRNAERLPHRLTKVGRFEKIITMLPPTQLQRFQIWRSILSARNVFQDDDQNVKEQDDDQNVKEGDKNDVKVIWAKLLTSHTSGCVASDLQRILRDAQTRSMARFKTSDRGKNGDDARLDLIGSLEWYDLQEAAKRTVPSQLSELDVISPYAVSHQYEEECALSNDAHSSVRWKRFHEYHWRNIGGYRETKKLVYRHVVAPWRHFMQLVGGFLTIPESDSTQEMNQKLSSWIDPPSGVLFHGPSGTGKSTVARFLAASLGLPMIQVRASDVLDKWLGGSEALLRSLFDRARAAAPCILFIDEIDAIASNRETDATNDFGSRILSTLLNEMDGVSSSIRSNQVLVIGCTNRIENIDSALLRPGRLQEHFLMDYPTLDDCNDILHLRLKNISLDKNVVLEDISRSLVEKHATGADVEGLCREVCLRAMRRPDMFTLDDSIQLTLSMEDFIDTIDCIYS